MKTSWRYFVKTAYNPYLDGEPASVDNTTDAKLQPWQVVDKYSTQYPKDPSFERGRVPRAKAIADSMQRAGWFHDNIQVPTKLEFAGIPGKDYDAERWVRGFRPHARAARIHTPGSVVYAASSNTDIPWVTFNDYYLSKELDDTGKIDLGRMFAYAAHENNHLANKDMLPHSYSRKGVPEEGIGRSKKEMDILDKAYRFNKDFFGFLSSDSKIGTNAANSEQGATNAEYRARLVDELSRHLGRNPTYDEFKSFIIGMSPEDIKDRYKRYANGYVKMDMGKDDAIRDELTRRMENGEDMEKAEGDLWNKYDPVGNDKGRLEDIRRAWLEVAKSKLKNDQRNII